MGKLFLFCFVLLTTVNAFGQKYFKCIEFKVVEKDSVTSVFCNLLVKNKNDSVLIENIVTQKNLAILINSSTFLYFIKGSKIIEFYPTASIYEYGNSAAWECEVIFNIDDSCTITKTAHSILTSAWGSTLNRDDNFCNIVNLKAAYLKSKKVKFKKKIKLKN
jgi:hypothetical protein